MFCVSHIKVSKTAFQWARPHKGSMIYRHVARSQLWGTPYSAQNINTHISEQLWIKGRLRVSWLMCCTDAWLRVVNQEGETSPGLCGPLIRTSLTVPQWNCFTLSSVTWKDHVTMTLIPIHLCQFQLEFHTACTTWCLQASALMNVSLFGLYTVFLWLKMCFITQHELNKHI